MAELGSAVIYPETWIESGPLVLGASSGIYPVYYYYTLPRSETSSHRSCLDDTELAYLGVSWSDYVRIADENGIDVLRLDSPHFCLTTFTDGFISGYHYRRGFLPWMPPHLTPT